MISYELYCQIQLFYKERGLSFAQIGRELNLDEQWPAKEQARSSQANHPALVGAASLQRRFTTSVHIGNAVHFFFAIQGGI